MQQMHLQKLSYAVIGLSLTTLSTCPAKQNNSSSVEVSVLLHVLALDLFFFF